MPCSATAAPRMKFPPPMTIATSAGSSCNLRISSARYFTYCGEMPNLRSPRRASPESLSSTRRYLAAPAFIEEESTDGAATAGPEGRGRRSGLAQGEPLEASHVHVLFGRGGHRRDEVLDRLRRVSDVRLTQQLLDARRLHRRDLHRDLLRELLEFVATRDEVGLARELHQRADASAGMDVRGHQALFGLALRLLGHRLDASLLDERERLRVVAPRLLERAFAVHDAGAALAAETLDLFRIDLCHHLLALLAGLDVGDDFWFDVRGDVLLVLFGLRLVYARRALGARHTDALELGDGRRRRVAHVLGARFLAARIEHRATFDDRVGHLLADELDRADRVVVRRA